MIIEIKDLPNDRSIKKITFDIEFEDGKHTVTTDATFNDKDSTVKQDFAFKEQIVERKEKPIPDEMLNQEF